MSRQNPVQRFWERLLDPYRERDWERCLRELRPVLDADEDAIVPRMLCAAIHQAAGQPALALLQYETLLPLAVGQGDFLRALAVQKHLDELHPAAASHAKRYEVLQRWFQALGQGVMPQGRDGVEPTPGHLLMLDSASFTRAAESCEIEGLEPAPRTVEHPGASLRFVLYGRTRWSLQTADDVTLIEGISEQGDAILVDPELGRRSSLLMTSELPSEHLVLNGDLLGLIPWADEVAPDISPAKDAGAKPASAAPPSVAPAPPASASPPPIVPMPARAPAKANGDKPTPAPPATSPPATPDRPRPDPRFEPMIASSAPVERRRETRLSIQLKSGVVRLGLADTRVAPLTGRLVQFTAGFVELSFARAELRHLRSRLEGSFLNVQLNMNPREELLLCVGRVRYTTSLAGESGSDELRIEVEFMPLPPRDQARIEAAVQARLERQRKDPESRAA